MSSEAKDEGLDGAAEAANEISTATAEQSDEVLEALRAEAAKAREHWDRLLRTTADFENFKKRSTREKQEAVKFANESLIACLLPILDNFEMAMAATTTAPGEGAQSLQAGVAMIHQQLKKALADAGLEEIDATNQVFDPNLHEAVSQQESKDVPEGHVLQQLRKGYKLRDRLLRPASVVVAKKPTH
jgi:molecular chaperone GrpE